MEAFLLGREAQGGAQKILEGCFVSHPLGPGNKDAPSPRVTIDAAGVSASLAESMSGAVACPWGSWGSWLCVDSGPPGWRPAATASRRMGTALLTPQARRMPSGPHEGCPASRRGPPGSKRLSEVQNQAPGAAGPGSDPDGVQSDPEPSLARGHRRLVGKVSLLVPCYPGVSPTAWLNCPPQPHPSPCTGWNGVPPNRGHPGSSECGLIGKHDLCRHNSLGCVLIHWGWSPL